MKKKYKKVPTSKMKINPTLFWILVILLATVFIAISFTFLLNFKSITRLDYTLFDNVSKLKVILLIFLKTIFDCLGINYELTYVVKNQHLNFLFEFNNKLLVWWMEFTNKLHFGNKTRRLPDGWMDFSLFNMLPTFMQWNIIRVQIFTSIVLFALVVASGSQIDYTDDTESLVCELYSVVWFVISYLFAGILVSSIFVIATPTISSISFFNFCNTYLELIANVTIKLPVCVLYSLIEDYLLEGNYCTFAKLCNESSITVIKNGLYLLLAFFILFSAVMIHMFLLNYLPFDNDKHINFDNLIYELDKKMNAAIINFSDTDQITGYVIKDLAETMFLLILPTERYNEDIRALCQMSYEIILFCISNF